MERVTGLGGIFFKCADVAATRAWYREHLGVPDDPQEGTCFHVRDEAALTKRHYQVWAPFARDSTYFEPSGAPFMINFRVANLAKMLEQLRAAGCAVDEKVEDTSYGKFGWVMDPDGVRIELWEPPAGE